jgi:tRNA(fMet)-specific endonuclease VapC
MTWMLDTNACIRYLNGRAPKLKLRIDATDPTDLRVCSIVKAELFFGAARSTDPADAIARQKYFLSRFDSLEFDDAAAEIYGGVRGELEKCGTPIGRNDLLIASIAIANGVVLVTHNVKEFTRVKGLVVEDWEV